MSGLWCIRAHFERSGDARNVSYRMDGVSEYAYPGLGSGRI
jgi:hypothetical protein